MKPFALLTPKTLFPIVSAILFITVMLSACGKTGSPTTPTGSGSGSNPPVPPPASTPVAPPVINQVSPLQGPAATAVTITGTGFSDTTANDTVYINGMMAKITAASGTQLVVAVPPLAGSGPVAVRVHGDSVTGPAFTYVYQYVVVTLAGQGAQGNSDGTGTAAGFNYPIGIAADASGNLYVGDQLNEKVRKITPAGVVTTLAGNGTPASADGTGNSATFYYPTGVTVDPSGNIYVTDLGGNTIRKVTSTGVVTTVAGDGGSGSANGAAATATFRSPTGVAIDKSGNLYIADAANNMIRMITPGGIVSTLAGSGPQGSADGTGAAASFYYPYGIAIDASGNLYVADARNNKIRKITSAGVVSTFAGSGGLGSADGTGTAASFNYPAGIAIDSAGNLYVADVDNSEIRKITPAGVVTTVAGSTTAGDTDGTGSAAAFSYPYGVTVDKSGNIYVTEQGNDKVRKITIQ
jgi:serine/threonine protein kinase, bacterial